MKRGQELVFSIEANDALDLVICEEEDIDAWLDDGEGDGEVDDGQEFDGEEGDVEERRLPDGYWHKMGVIESVENSFIAPKGGRYVLLLVNWHEEGTEVNVDATVWSAE